MNLGENIYKLRVKKHMSQSDLADALEVSRQSISKWETNSSIPELDKLVKMSELFGVSLDELILDKPAAEPASTTSQNVIYVEKEKSISTAKIVGIVLLCFAGLVWLIVTLFGDLIAGFVLAAPFVGCGLICLLVDKNIALWCAWVVFLFMEFYLRIASGINWTWVLFPQMYTYSRSVELVIAWVLMAIFITLIVITALRLREKGQDTIRKDLIGTISFWAVYLLTWSVLLQPDHSAEINYSYSFGHRFVSALSGWLRGISMAVALVFTVRFIASLFNRHKKETS